MCDLGVRGGWVGGYVYVCVCVCVCVCVYVCVYVITRARVHIAEYVLHHECHCGLVRLWAFCVLDWRLFQQHLKRERSS